MDDFKIGLQKIGIIGREAEVYISLLQKKVLTVAEISKISTVSLNKIHEVFQNLLT